MSFLDTVWDQVKAVQLSFDGWVAQNMSRKTQNMVIFGIFLAMIIHLVYTKRKLTREHKEQLQQEAQEKEKSRLKKKVK